MNEARLLQSLKLGLAIQLERPRGGQFQVDGIVQGEGLGSELYRHQKLGPRSLYTRSFSITGGQLP